MSSASQTIYVGELQVLEKRANKIVATRRVYAGHDIIVGRDVNKCQWVLNDPQMSAKHLRIYTVIYDSEEDDTTEYLVYAEDLSRNGTFWNGSLIGRGNGGFLLCHNDTLRLSDSTSFRFTTTDSHSTQDRFDLQQEREMTHFRHEYIVTDRLLGMGAFGKVFMAVEQHTRTQVACKVVDLRKLCHRTSKHFPISAQPMQRTHSDGATRTQDVRERAEKERKGSDLEAKLSAYYREVEILSQLSHPNIIGLDKVYVTDNTIYMFQDLITAGDLFSYLESKNGRLTEVDTAVIVRQILVGLRFLHDQNIVHRDLKPENIMMTSLSTGCRVVLTDFGAARQVNRHRRMSSIVGSEHYAAPEIKASSMRDSRGITGYSKAVDMWSVGAITVVLMTGGHAFSDPFTGAYSPVMAQTCNLDSLQKSREWQQMRERPRSFVLNLLVLEEQKRMTACKALQHGWFCNDMHKIDFEELYKRTIRNWYPRIAKNPVVEFIHSTFVRKLPPSQSLIGTRKRSRQEMRPIDPPYKPFPRNMHMALWPQKNPLGPRMSDEVRAAIANIWTGDSVKRPSRFHTDTSIPKGTLGDTGTEGVSTGKESVNTTINALQKTDRSLTLAQRPKMFPKSPTPTAVASSSHLNAQLIDQPGISQRKRPLVERRQSLPPSRTTRGLQMNSFMNSQRSGARGLHRSSSCNQDGLSKKKAWRSSMFDVLDDHENESNDRDRDGWFSSTKRARLDFS